MTRIKERLAKHEKVCIAYSGGKDSLACVHLLRDYLDGITIYHNELDDVLPETRESVAVVEAFAPHFVRIMTPVSAFIARHGLPSDLLPHASHPLGQEMGESIHRLVWRYDCCSLNLMKPLMDRVLADGNTLMIRGVKTCDMQRLPAKDGDVQNGIEVFHPIEDWSDADVFAYLRAVGAAVPRFYDYTSQGIDCARCSAWLSEGRGAYLRQFHPDLYRDYRARLQVVAEEIAGPLALLAREMAVSDG
jgi:3'-phosphoadenosine 5'-phosphosulfate sulfotransferase (PAPS reductase)/FAD synthetase